MYDYNSVSIIVIHTCLLLKKSAESLCIKVGLLNMVCEIRNVIVTGLGEEISSSKLQQ